MHSHPQRPAAMTLDPVFPSSPFPWLESAAGPGYPHRPGACSLAVLGTASTDRLALLSLSGDGRRLLCNGLSCFLDGHRQASRVKLFVFGLIPGVSLFLQQSYDATSFRNPKYAYPSRVATSRISWKNSSSLRCGNFSEIFGNGMLAFVTLSQKLSLTL